MHPSHPRPDRPAGPRARAGAGLLPIGAALVSTLAPAPAEGQRLPRPTPAAVVGCLACEGVEAFGQIFGVALLPDGTLAVLDRDVPMIRLFGPDGEARGAFGSRGRGPGEMARPMALAATADGSILVADALRSGVHRFTRDGAPLPPIPTDAAVMRLRSDPTGRWIALQVPDWRSMTAGVHLVDAGGEAVGRPLPSTAGTILDAEGRPAAPGLFSASPGPDARVAVGHGDVYRIVILDPSGERLGEAVRDVKRRPRSPEEIARRAAAIRRGPAGRDGHPEAGGDAPEVDPLHPHFGPDALAWDREGRLWVRTERGGPDGTVFDLFDRGGTFLGEVSLPSAVGAFTLGGATLVAVVTDPVTGVQRVRRWRLR